MSDEEEWHHREQHAPALGPTTNTFSSIRPGVPASGSGDDAANDEVETTNHECQVQLGASEVCEQIMGGDSESEAEAPASADEGEAAEDHECEHDAEPEQEEARGEEEVEPPKVAAQPRLPGRDEVDVHEAMGHAQYRNWCEACVYGQGREYLNLRGANMAGSPSGEL